MGRRNVVAVKRQPSLPRNVDLLAWFSEDERQVCGSCGERSAVSVPDALALFCLRCGAVAIDGVRVDVDGRLEV
jgi:ribosomal protein S27AE